MTPKNTTKIPLAPESADASAVAAEFQKRSSFAADVEFNVSAIRTVADLICGDLIGGYEPPAKHRHTDPDTGQAALRVVALALEALQLSAIDAGERDWNPEEPSVRWRGLSER